MSGMHTLATAFGFAGALLIVIMVVPQLRQVHSRSAQGVSVRTWWLQVVVCCTWAGYGWMIGSAPIIWGNAITFVLVGLLVSELVRGRGARVMLLAWAIPVVAAAAAVMVLPALAVGFLAVTASVLMGIPQTVQSLRHSRDTTPSAVSRTTWSLFGVGVACWLAYSILDRDVPAMVANVAASAMAWTIVVAETYRHRRSGRAGAAAAIDVPDGNLSRRAVGVAVGG
ncbi:MAG: hypothetical protein WCP28_11875 [Actinomycetes bacterium]